MYASAIDVGVSSTSYTLKSSPKDFTTLCLLLLLEASLSSFSRISSFLTGCSENSTAVVGSGVISEENLEMLVYLSLETYS
jgi:hypothetical protein